LMPYIRELYGMRKNRVVSQNPRFSSPSRKK
jgi:hypothetical protein